MADFTPEELDMIFKNRDSALADAISAYATRPQKARVKTWTTSSEVPFARQNMIENRDKVRQASQALNDALKIRETTAYSLANALANIPQQQGAGSWLTDFARAFGGGMVNPMNMYADRAQQAHENEMKDLEMILDYDKAMGGTTTQNQEQNIGYDDLPWSGGGKDKKDGKGESLGGVPLNNFGRSVGYDPVANVPEFGAITRAALDDKQISQPLQWVPGTQSLAKGLTSDDTRNWVQTTWQDISDNILKGSTLDFIGTAGSVRIADTEDEKRAILGELYNYKGKDPVELTQLIRQARNNFVTVGLKKAKEQGVPVTAQELKNYFNSAFTVPQYLQSKSMYNTQDRDIYNTPAPQRDWSKYKQPAPEAPKADADPWAKYRTK
jgi:hypothetical protein